MTSVDHLRAIKGISRLGIATTNDEDEGRLGTTLAAFAFLTR